MSQDIGNTSKPLWAGFGSTIAMLVVFSRGRSTA
jgi:hypothetical protein